jgi:hypothetical protein
MKVLQDEVARLAAAQNKPFQGRTPARSMTTPSIMMAKDTNEAILDHMAAKASNTTTVYQREEKLLVTWDGKDSVAVPDPDRWIQQVVIRSQRQGRTVLEYLQDVTTKTAELWVNNLLRAQASHLLQQSQVRVGRLKTDPLHPTKYVTSGDPIVPDGTPVSRVEEITDAYILQDFQKTFMLNRQDKTEQHLLALFAGTACKQGPTDSVSDYLLAFQAATWQANFDPLANKNHTHPDGPEPRPLQGGDQGHQKPWRV